MRPVWLLSLSAMIGVGLLLSGGCAPEYPNCRSDEDCQRVNPREVCVDGQCRQCRDDSQCDRGQQCDDNSCVGIPGWCEEARDCSDGQICIDNRCLPCESDDQCQTGYGQNYWCDGGSCVDSCRSDADCPAGQRCVAGECVSEEEQIANCALDPVYFDFDSSTIRSDMRDVLQANAQCIRERSISSVSLEGNCDPRGTTEYNYALGDRRASAVKRVIVGHGVPGRSLRTVSYGEDRASGTGEDSWARDRRVDFSQ